MIGKCAVQLGDRRARGGDALDLGPCRARPRRPTENPLLAGGLDRQSVPLRRHQGHRGGVARAGAAGPLRRDGDHDPRARRRHSYRGERRRGGRPDVHHLAAQAGHRVVRRHAVHRRRRGVLRRVLPERGDGLQSPLQLHRCHQGGGAGRPHRAHQLRRGQALPLRAVRRLHLAHSAEGAVRELHRRQGADLHGAEFRTHRHRPLQGGRVPRQRRHHLLGQRELSRARQARLRHRHLQGRRGCHLGRARRALHRRVRLRLEPADRARSAGADGGERQGPGGRRLRHDGGASGGQSDQQLPRPRQGQALAPPRRHQPAPLPLRPGGKPRFVTGHRPPDPGRFRLRRGRSSHLQRPARAAGLRVGRQRCLHDPEYRGGQPHPRRGRLAAGR